MGCYYDSGLGCKVHKYKVDFFSRVCVCDCGESVTVRRDTLNFGMVARHVPNREAKMYQEMVAKKFWVVTGVSIHTGDVYTLSHPILEEYEANALAKKLEDKMGKRFTITVEERDVETELAKS